MRANIDRSAVEVMCETLQMLLTSSNSDKDASICREILAAGRRAEPKAACDSASNSKHFRHPTLLRLSLSAFRARALNWNAKDLQDL